MAVLTLIKYTGISVEDAELSIGAVRRGNETAHQAFVRKIKALTRGGMRKTFDRKYGRP